MSMECVLAGLCMQELCWISGEAHPDVFDNPHRNAPSLLRGWLILEQCWFDPLGCPCVPGCPGIIWLRNSSVRSTGHLCLSPGQRAGSLHSDMGKCWFMLDLLLLSNLCPSKDSRMKFPATA